MAWCLVGFHNRLCLELAPANMAIPHARCSTLRIEPRTAASYQLAFSHRQYTAVVGPASPHDGRVGPEYVCGRIVCRPPATCRVGGLGGGAQGCPEYVLWAAGPMGVCSVYAAARS